jgi:hypothetical protein
MRRHAQHQAEPEHELPSDRHVDGITPQQAIALEALLSGRTQGDAAVLANVGSSTVSVWFRDDPKFTMAYDVGKAAMHRAIARRLDRVAYAGLGTIDKHVEAEDPRVALYAARAAVTAWGRVVKPSESDVRPQQPLIVLPAGSKIAILVES